MLTALTLCLGIQIGAAAAAPGIGGHALHVFVEDEAGTLLVDGWSVRVGRWAGTSIQWVEKRAVDPTTGVAAFTALGDPVCVVQALHDTQESSDREQIRLRPSDDGSGPAVHGLVFEGPTPERSLFVIAIDSQGLSWTDDTLELVAVGKRGQEIPLHSTPEAPQRYVARGLEAGNYRVELRDPRFLPMALEQHPTGVIGTVRPVGSSTALIRFVDAVDGEPVDVTSHFEVIWTMSSVVSTPSGSSTRGSGVAGPRSEVRVAGLVPGASVRIEATFAAHYRRTVELTDFTPGERRVHEARVDRGRTARGTIIDATGAPVANVPVTAQSEGVTGAVPLTPGKVQLLGRVTISGSSSSFSSSVHSSAGSSAQGMAALVTSLSPDLAAPRNCTSDPSGAFVLRGLAPETTKLTVCFTPWHQEVIALPARTVREGIDPTTVAAVDDLPLVLRAPGAAGADLEFMLPPRTNLDAYEVNLQIGDGPWLRQDAAVAPLVDERQRMTLRGLPEVPCRLAASIRTSATLPPLAPPPTRPPATFEFVPRVGHPTVVRIDLTSLAPLR